MNLDELERLHRARGLEDDSCQQFCDAVALAFPALLALARDGERYRWLRDNKLKHNGDAWHWVPGEPLWDTNLDAAIDAMKERTEAVSEWKMVPDSGREG